MGNYMNQDTLCLPEQLSTLSQNLDPLKFADLIEICGHEDAGQKILDIIAELYPICRSITGDGMRESLAIIKKLIPLQIHEVPSGTDVLDWTVPKEWNIRGAYVNNPR